MRRVAIAGSGISGLILALRLQQAGVDTALYSESTPDQIRDARLLNLVARFEPARARERALGVDHWEFPDFGMFCGHFSVVGTPLAFRGDLAMPAAFVDFRVYLPRLLEDYANRGGDVVVVPSPVQEAIKDSERFALVVVAGGRHVGDVFARNASRSTFTAPQRILCAGTYHGVAHPEPMGLSYNVVPGAGEIFQAPIFSVGGRTAGLLVEAIPGGPLEPITHMSYTDDPKGFEAAMLDTLRQYAPAVYERVDPAEFALTRPVDLLQGAITPTVREAWQRLDGGTFAVAIGDAWVLNDPVVGQGANLGSHCAGVLADAIVEDLAFDEMFCRSVEDRMWQMAGPVTAWTNAFLQPPPQHVVDLLGAATGSQAVADNLVEGFSDPQLMWRRVATPERAAAFLEWVQNPGSEPQPPTASS